MDTRLDVKNTHYAIMKTRIPDPFPWPDDEICVEFGRSSYYAHKLEREMKLFLLGAHIVGRISIDYPSTEYKSVESFLYDQTLGPLIHILKSKEGLKDKKLKEGLFGALKARNILAHAALENHDPMYYQISDRQTLIRTLQDLRFRIGVPYLIIRELRKVVEEEIGITEEQLQARLRRSSDWVVEE